MMYADENCMLPSSNGNLGWVCFLVLISFFVISKNATENDTFLFI